MNFRIMQLKEYFSHKEFVIASGGNNTEVDMLDLATITSMGEEAEANSEMYLGEK